LEARKQECSDEGWGRLGQPVLRGGVVLLKQGGTAIPEWLVEGAGEEKVGNVL
jgi:hypothetical protein